MCVSQSTNKLFIVIVVGMFLASGCSGHSVKYGANSEGEDMASGEGMTRSGDGITYGSDGIARYADGTPVHGGTVDGNNAYLRSGQGNSNMSGDMKSGMAALEGNTSVPGGGSNYGHQYGGVDGTGPNHGGVTGFGSGSANSVNPDPEAWANAYLRGKRGDQDFYGDGSGNNGGSASSMEGDPEKWAQAYLQENGGPSPEYVDPDMSIAQTGENKDSRLMAMVDSNGKLLEMSNTNGGAEGRVQDIYFAFDSWTISPEGARYLGENAKWLHANPEKSLTIEGHCDQRGTQDYNLVLGKKRAEAAREYLLNLGVQPHRIKIVSYGKERPFCKSDNEYCHQENRRNHMVVRMNQS